METKRLVIVAVGGQGNLLASSVLGEAALLTGIPLHMSEIHGMAQRGGVVESSLIFGDAESTIISTGKPTCWLVLNLPKLCGQSVNAMRTRWLSPTWPP